MAAVYDKEKEKQGINTGQHDDLGIDPDQRADEVADLENQFAAPSAEEPNSDEGLDNSALESAEEAAGAPDYTPDDQIGEGFKDTGKRKSRGKFFTRRRLIGAGVGGVVGGGAFGLLLLLMPALRLESYLSRIDQRAFAFASSAVGARVEHLFDRYMVSHILNLQTCTKLKSIDCKANYAGMGSATSLFTTWRDVKIEEKIFDDMHFTIESRTNPNPGVGVHQFTLRDTRTGGEIKFSNADDWDNKFKKGQFTGGRREIGKELKGVIKKETEWYQVMKRKSIRNYLTRKHGVKFWCFFACKTKDSVEIKALSAKTRFKAKFVERFVYPFSGKYGFILDCLMSGTKTPGEGPCNVTALRKKGVSREVLPDKTVEKIIQDIQDNPTKRLSQIVIENLLDRIMRDISMRAAAQSVVDSIPVIGQIYFALVVTDMFDKMDGFIKNHGLSKYAAEINASQYLEYYTAMSQFNDEMKSGKASFEEVGAVMSEFEGAEDSKVYQAYNPPNVASSFLNTKAFAAPSSQTTGKDPYVCADGNPMPSGELVCKEKKVTRTFAIEDWRNNAVVDGIVGILEHYDCAVPEVKYIGCPPGMSPRSYIRPVLGAISDISNAVFGTIAKASMAILKAIPKVGDVINFVEGKFQELIMAFFGKVFPLPIQLDSPGRDKYDGLEAGADVAAAEFAKGGTNDSGESYGLGAPSLSDADAVAIMHDQLDQRKDEYNKSGFFARLTNIDYPNSLANKVIAFLPNNLSQIPSSIATVFSNILGSVFNFSIFNSLLGKTMAQTQAASPTEAAVNAFGISRYGYALNDPALTRDPAELTDEFCQNAKKAREGKDSKTENELTGVDEYTLADPCLLEAAAIEAGGSFFLNEDSSQTSTQPPGSTGISPDGFVFPQSTTKNRVITGVPGGAWCYQGQTNCHHDYNAADIFAPTGTGVLAARGGKVVRAVNNHGSSTVGSRVTIKGDDGLVYYYAHMGEGTITVREDDIVKAGQLIGLVGTREDADNTPPHLHFDVLPSSYDSRVSCSGSACSGYPFINVQPSLISAFNNLAP